MPLPHPAIATADRDHRLVGLLQLLAHSRDAAAWEELISCIRSDLLRITARITADPGLAEDAAQETLLTIRDHASSFRQPATGDPEAAARGWIKRIAVNASLNLLRGRDRQALRERAAASTSAQSPASPLDIVVQNEQNAVIRIALDGLSGANRAAVALHHIDGLSIPEVGQALGITTETAKKRVHRGVESMRRRLRTLGVASSTVFLLEAMCQSAAASEFRIAVVPEMSPWRQLLISPRHGSSRLIPPPKGFPMSLKISLPIAAALVAGLVSWSSAQDGVSVTDPTTGAHRTVASAPKSHAATKADVDKKLEASITVNFVDVAFADAMSQMAVLGKTTITIDPAIDQKQLPTVNLKLAKTPLSTALTNICMISGVTYEVRDGGVAIIAPK